MSVEAVSEITNKALYLTIKVSMPILLVSLIIGLVVSIFQTVTSIQEQTLTFIVAEFFQLCKRIGKREKWLICLFPLWIWNIFC